MYSTMSEKPSCMPTMDGHHRHHSFGNEMMSVDHSLEAELIRLRESTKDALQQAWEEVETLQQQCTAHLEITAQLEQDLLETKRKEEYWHKRCLESEKLLMQTNSHDIRSIQEKNFVVWPSMKLPIAKKKKYRRKFK